LNEESKRKGSIYSEEMYTSNTQRALFIEPIQHYIDIEVLLKENTLLLSYSSSSTLKNELSLNNEKCELEDESLNKRKPNELSQKTMIVQNKSIKSKKLGGS
jgi:hypothetical protein